MKLGIALPAYDLEMRHPLTVRELAEAAQAAEAAGFDSAWVMDHYFMTRGPHRVSGQEPLIALAHIAALTTDIELGVMVACNTFRSPMQLAREAATLSDASDGRFLLGLGCGSQEPEHKAFGIPFDHRVTRLRETMAILPSLMNGESVDYAGGGVHVTGGRIVATRPAPPIYLAAFGPKMMELAAGTGSGWITAWHGRDTGAFERQLEDYGSALANANRSRSDVNVIAGVLAFPLDGESRDASMKEAERVSEGFAEPVDKRAVVGSASEIADTVRTYWNLGADTVVLSLAPAHFGRFRYVDLRYVDEIGRHLRQPQRSGAKPPG